MSLSLGEIINKSIFFLGAGAAQEAGCKTSPEMLIDLNKRFQEIDDKSSYKKEALDFLMSCLFYHSTWKSKKQRNFAHSPNIEEFVLLLRRIVGRESYLPYPITGSWSDKINILEAKEENFFYKLLVEVENLLDSWLSIENEPPYDYLNPLTELLQTYTKDRFIIDIFTLNYDLVFERHFNREGINDLYSGFSSNEWVGFHERSQAGYNERIYYYKLHGSLDWWKLQDGSIVSDIQSFSDEMRTNVKPLRIFGHSNKFHSVDPFMTLVYEFREQLKAKKYFFVLGYSFFDPYINNLFFEALSQQVDKKLIVINPWILDKYENLRDSFELGEKEFEITEKDLKNLSERFLEIQQSHFLSELPDFNVLNISPTLMNIIPLKTGRFFDEYFGNKGDRFINFVNELEQNTEEQQKLFI